MSRFTQKKKTVKINADDYGADIPRSIGISVVALMGAITSTSILVKDVSRFEIKIACFLAKYRALSLGLHVDLTSENLIFTTASGITFGKILFQDKRDVWMGLVTNKVDYTLIEMELRAQVDLFLKKFNVLPSFIDSHNHVHIANPQIYNLFKKVSEEFGIPCERIPFDRMDYKKSLFAEEILENFKKHSLSHKVQMERFDFLPSLVENMRSSRNADIALYFFCIHRLIMQIPEVATTLSYYRFYGTLYGHTRTLKDMYYLIRELKNAPSGSYEVMLHPGFNLFKNPLNPFSNIQRLGELLDLLLTKVWTGGIKNYE